LSIGVVNVASGTDSRGDRLDLIVEFYASAIQAQAADLNRERGLAFDDAETLRFKVERYADLKKSVLSSLPAGGVVVLKDYPALPLMFLRFRSLAALRVLLADPLVIGVHEDSSELLKRP